MSHGIEIPDHEVVSIDHVASGVVGLRIMLVNVFAVTGPQGWVLVDAGLPLSEGRILRWTETQFPRHKPCAVVLTHGHFDHVGALTDLLRDWGVPIFAHELEHPFLTGKSKYPPPDATAGGGFMSLLAPFYPRGPIDVSSRLQALPKDGSVPFLDGWRWIATPGHTQGHVSFYRESDGCLLVGDAFCTTKQESVLSIATQKPELHGPPAYYTSDWNAAKLSVEKLASLKPQTVAPGHGSPMSGTEVAPALKLLARDFDQVAIPRRNQNAA